MTVVDLGGLALLALVDSTSFGTLGLPILMLARPRVAVRAYLCYLAVISGFYALLGLALLVGAGMLAARVGQAAEHPAALWAQLVVGVLLLGGSFLVDRRGRAWLRRVRGRADPAPAPRRHDRWAARLTGPDADLRVVGAVALAAGLVEAASMIPYLGAIGILAASGLSWPLATAVLGAYVLVMALPAIVLLGMRLALAGRIEDRLGRLQAWIERNSDDALGWIVGIVGFILTANAVAGLAQAGLLG